MWVAVALFVVLTLWPLQDTFMLTDNTYTRKFCAYGSVYVEFQQGNKIWGTTFLDERGKPVGCTDSDVQHTISNKEII
jgi:drug/metabolite transporter superfamily protein YnfA